MTTQTRLGLRKFYRELPREGRWLLSTIAIQTLGRGLTLPFTIIYVHEVRGIALDVAGVLMALIAVAALAATGPGGWLIDRVGGRVVMLSAAVSHLLGCVTLAFATTVPVFVVGFTLLGFAFGVSWAASNTLISSIVAGPLRQQYFGVNFALINLGIGVGGVIGGLVADVGRPMTFTAIFVADAATMLVPICLLLGPLRHLRGGAAPSADGQPTSGSYASLLRRPAVALLSVVTFVTVLIGYAQLESGFPAFARQFGGVSTTVIGVAFALNTAVIVGLQFPVQRAVAGRSRTSMLCVMAGLWVIAWLILALAGVMRGSIGASVAVVVFMSLFALGEVFMQLAIPTITNDLADDHTRGRANSINSGAFQLGAIIGPIVSGAILARGVPAVFIGLMLVGAVAVAALTTALSRRLSPAANGLASHEEAVSAG